MKTDRSSSPPEPARLGPHRRAVLTAGLASGAAVATAVELTQGRAHAEPIKRATATREAAEFGVLPNAGRDVTAALQNAIDTAAQAGAVLQLAAGHYAVSRLALPPGSKLCGVGPQTVLVALSQASPLTAKHAQNLGVANLAIDGGDTAANLITLDGCRDLAIDGITAHRAAADAISLTGCSGRLVNSAIAHAGQAAIHALDSAGLAITGNTIRACRNNGIQVWRSTAGPDGTLVANNRIEKIDNADGGSGQYGNGINIFRADNCIVTSNVIDACSYSAIRGNQASNLQIVANTATRSGEVALYAEFAFEGVVIANNIVDGAASGISVTNFNDGGRLAVIQGNLIRNLSRREHEPVDKRGVGISAEADASVTGNVIEGAPTAAIRIGWGRFQRNCAVTGNTVRASANGILISDHAPRGACLIANNLLSDTPGGGIRLMQDGAAVGPELARTATTDERLAISGNLLV